MLAAGVIAAALAATAAWAVGRIEAAALAQWRSRLELAADDRVESIERALEAGLADARTVAAYPTAVFLVAGSSQAPYPFPAEHGPEAHLQMLLASYVGQHGYRAVWLVDGAGRVVASVGRQRLEPACLAHAQRALRAGGRAPAPDVHRHDGAGSVVAFAAPVRSVPPWAGRAEGVIGAVLVETDAQGLLGPLLNLQGMGAETAEAVVVRRDGPDLAYLLPTRHGAPATQELRLSPATPELAASAALAADKGFGAFRDYQGHRVLAATRRMNDVPWGLVVKVDKVEALAPARAQAKVAVVAALALILATAALSFGVWGARRAAYEASLARTERHWAMLLDHAHDPIFYVGTDGRVREANRRAAEVYGYSREELRGMNVQALHRGTPEVVLEVMETVRDAGGALVQMIHTRRSGEAFPVEVSSRFVDTGDDQFFLFIVRDMSERRREEEEKRWLLRVIEQSPASIVITDTSGAIRYVNPRFTAVSGYAPEEVLGRNPRILKSDQTPPEIYAELWRRISSGEEWQGELLNRRKDGSLFWEEARISGVRDPDGRVTHYVAVKEDVTARKEAQRALREAQDQLLQSQKMEAVGKLAGGVAHDFNNLLGVILGYAEMLARSFAPDDPRRQRTQEITRASQRAAALTRQLLAFSRRQVLQPRPVDLAAAVQDMSKLLRRLIGEDIELAVSASEGEAVVMVDASQLDQVIMNLAVNARDAMPRGGRLTVESAVLRVRGERACDGEPVPDGSYAALRVADEGCGMPPDVQRRIFEPFFTTKRAGEGTGLGLATVYGIVKQSGGFITVHSVVGQGSTFTVLLPLLRQPVGTAAVREDVPSAGGCETILLVEDQEALRAVLSEGLSSLGYNVLEAESGEQALDMAARHRGRIDLLVTDVVMAGINGVDLVQAMRVRWPSTKAVLISGYPGEVVARHGMAAASDVLLQKPFTADVLAARVRTALDGEARA